MFWRSRLAALLALFSFDGLPLLVDLCFAHCRQIVKNVWMTPDQFCLDCFADVEQLELARFLIDVGKEIDLHEEVAELAADIFRDVVVDGIKDFIGFFEKVFFDGVRGLFSIPWASAGRT